jgi:hypothetical protein
MREEEEGRHRPSLIFVWEECLMMWFDGRGWSASTDGPASSACCWGWEDAYINGRMELWTLKETNKYPRSFFYFAPFSGLCHSGHLIMSSWSKSRFPKLLKLQKNTNNLLPITPSVPQHLLFDHFFPPFSA